MANSKKNITLQEALDFVLNSDTEYNEELSSDEETDETDEENDPCYRVSINFVDSDDPDKILTPVSTQHIFSFRHPIHPVWSGCMNYDLNFFMHIC